MHDIVVGLLCFDHVYAPIDSVDRIHDLLGSDRFWQLVQDEVLSFINWRYEEGIVFPDETSISNGRLDYFLLKNPNDTEFSSAQIIRKQLKSAPGKEEEVERLFEKLDASTQEIRILGKGSIPNIVRSLLLRPSIRQLLGVSGGISLNSIPRWNVFRNGFFMPCYW